MDPVELDEHESELEKHCIELAESALATHTPDLARSLSSSREASGVCMSILVRSLAGKIPYNTARIAENLAGHTQDVLWPDWREGIPERPVRAPCPSCATEIPTNFKLSWQWCPACGSELPAVLVARHDEETTPVAEGDHETEVANHCIEQAESMLATHTPELARRFISSREASGVGMSILRRSLSNEIPYATAQIAASLARHAHDVRWPNWRDGIAKPSRRRCPSCATEMPLNFKRSWPWCAACGSALL